MKTETYNTYDYSFNGDNALDESDKYWLSSSESKESWIKVLFDDVRSFSKINIVFKYPPMKFSILVLVGHNWNVIKEAESPELDYVFTFPMIAANGV